MIRSDLLEPNFNISFPFEKFPWRLEVNKDHHNIKGIALTVCHFECEEHLQKYIDRYKLKAKDYNVSNRDGKSLRSSQKHTRSVESPTRKKSNRSTSTVRKGKSIMDSTGDSTGSAKRNRKVKGK